MYLYKHIHIFIQLALSPNLRSGGLADPGGPGEMPHRLRGQARQLRGEARAAQFHRGTGHDAL